MTIYIETREMDTSGWVDSNLVTEFKEGCEYSILEVERNTDPKLMGGEFKYYFQGEWFTIYDREIVQSWEEDD